MSAAELSGMPEFRWVQAEGLIRKHSRMKRVQVWNGSEGALGYFCHLLQQRRSDYVRMLGILLGPNMRVMVAPADNDEESQRERLERKMPWLRYFVGELINSSSAKNMRGLLDELAQRGLRFDKSMIPLIEEEWSVRRSM